MLSRFLFLFFILLTFGFFSNAQAATFTVTTASDAIPAPAGSLRWAIEQSNNNAVLDDTINFNIAGSGVKTINLVAALPPIEESLTINGATQAGYFGTPVVELNGSAAGSAADGLLIQPFVFWGQAHKIKIIALAVNRFGGNGIEMLCESGCELTVQACFIGTNPAGTTDLGNGANGIEIFVHDEDKIYIGGTGAFERNVISGNSHNGIYTHQTIPAPPSGGAATTTILGNFIGTNAGGTADLGNGLDGIEISTGAAVYNTVTVGGTAAAAANVISGNGANGISGDATTIKGNYIGTNAGGTSAIPNSDYGISAGNTNLIGGTEAGAGNVISGNGESGIYGGGKIQGNRIGTNAAGTSAIPNNQHGIFADFGSSSTPEIGMESNPASGNLISGNGGSGVYLIDQLNAKVFENKIGTNLAGTASLPNQGDGIKLDFDVQYSHCICPHIIKRNVISGNAGIGIAMTGEDIKNTQIEANYIGTNASGANLGNGGNGVSISSAALENYIGGAAAGAGNTIAFNAGKGVSIAVSAGLGNLVRGNSIYSNGTLGIDLGTTGVTANDMNDADTGANNLQNFPVLLTASSVQLTGTLNSQANQNFTVEFFRVDSCDASGSGEGRYFLGAANVATGSDFNANFTVSSLGLTAGQIITATATDANGNTSEFSPCKTVTPPPGNFSFTSATYNINEVNPTMTIGVIRTGGSFGAIAVDFSTADGTAIAGQDYAATSQTITFADGQTSKTVNIPITNDLLDEPTETVNLSLSNPTGGANVINPSTAVLNIGDNDNPPTISISDVTLAEGNQGATNFVFNINLSAASGFDIAVNYATANGTANAPVDYAAQNGTLSFSAATGETNKTVTIAVNSDFLPELNETFFVNLSNSINATVADNQGLGTISDDDNPGKFSFALAPYSGTEHDLVTVTVARTNGTAGTVSIDYATGGGTATPFTDYEPVAGTLIFADGETTKTFNVVLGDDAVAEPTENVNLILSNPNGGASLSVPAITVLNIFDNDSGTLLSIGGEIRKPDNSPLVGATVNLTGATSAQTTTDAQGRYSFPSLAPNGNYAVTPAAIGFTFNPINRQYSNLSSDVANANFTATPAPSRQLRIVGGNAAPTQNITATVELVAQGDENSVGFSLNFDPQILTNPSVALAADSLSATLIVNDTQAGSGRLGVLLAMPSGTSFAAGTKSLAVVTFNTLPTAAYNSPLTFGDNPVVKRVANSNADPLPTNYLDGAVTFAQGYEADVTPRPTGKNNGAIMVTDFTQVGRFVAGLDQMNPNYNEFQRADCAPRITLGDGVLDVTDFTQAGLYAANLNPITPTGGQTNFRFRVSDFGFLVDERGNPKSQILNLKSNDSAPTVVRVVNAQASAGQQIFVTIAADAQGTENGFGFTLDYDQTKLSAPLVTRGADTQAAILIPNVTQAGKVGVVLAMPFGEAIGGGTRHIVTIRFNVAANAASGQTWLTFADAPVVRAVSDVNAATLNAAFQDGAVNILGPTAAGVSLSGRVTTGGKRRLSAAQVSIADASGTIRFALASPTGTYHFEGLAAGETYTISVVQKGVTFKQPTVVMTVLEDTENVNFVGN